MMGEYLPLDDTKESHMTQKKGTGLLMVWTDVPADKEADFNRWYNEEHLADMTLYEFEHPAVSASAAWAAQRDISPVTHRIRPHMRHAPGSPGIWVKTFQLES